MRCRTLATALKKNGAEVKFITRAHAGHLGDMLTHEGFTVTLLPRPDTPTIMGDNYAAWLGVSQQEDAKQSICALENQPCDLLIVDHYGLDHVWERLLQPHTSKLMVVDDLANRAHVCDVLLDQNYAVAEEERYRPWVPKHCQLLLGPRYALLRPEYAQYSKTMAPRSEDIKRVLVYMGGGDNANITGKVLAALSVSQLAHLEVDVVIGVNFIHKCGVTEQANARPNTRIHNPRPHLADLMAKADLAVGAGGATTWERHCMKLPSIVITIAENQEQSISALHEKGYVYWAGSACTISSDTITDAIKLFLIAAKKSNELNISDLIVDGRGVERVEYVLLGNIERMNCGSP
jgi:UDP-2,4-diacetamido-2,4,6-trideoxy-beta-L-altropyranose hydrolase